MKYEQHEKLQRKLPCLDVVILSDNLKMSVKMSPDVVIKVSIPSVMTIIEAIYDRFGIPRPGPSKPLPERLFMANSMYHWGLESRENTKRIKKFLSYLIDEYDFRLGKVSGWRSKASLLLKSSTRKIPSHGLTKFLEVIRYNTNNAPTLAFYRELVRKYRRPISWSSRPIPKYLLEHTDHEFIKQNSIYYNILHS